MSRLWIILFNFFYLIIIDVNGRVLSQTLNSAFSRHFRSIHKICISFLWSYLSDIVQSSSVISVKSFSFSNLTMSKLKASFKQKKSFKFSNARENDSNDASNHLTPLNSSTEKRRFNKLNRLLADVFKLEAVLFTFDTNHYKLYKYERNNHHFSAIFWNRKNDFNRYEKYTLFMKSNCGTQMRIFTVDVRLNDVSCAWVLNQNLKKNFYFFNWSAEFDHVTDIRAFKVSFEFVFKLYIKKSDSDAFNVIANKFQKS